MSLALTKIHTIAASCNRLICNYYSDCHQVIMVIGVNDGYLNWPIGLSGFWRSRISVCRPRPSYAFSYFLVPTPKCRRISQIQLTLHRSSIESPGILTVNERKFLGRLRLPPSLPPFNPVRISGLGKCWGFLPVNNRTHCVKPLSETQAASKSK